MTTKYDVTFVCETWLQPSELEFYNKSFREKNDNWVYLKSSIDPGKPLCGRPDGGVGLICKRKPGVSYSLLQSNSDRICAVQMKCDTKVCLTIIGVYMPHYNGSTDQMQKFAETLTEMQCIMDNNEVSPTL